MYLNISQEADMGAIYRCLLRILVILIQVLDHKDNDENLKMKKKKKKITNSKLSISMLLTPSPFLFISFLF